MRRSPALSSSATLAWWFKRESYRTAITAALTRQLSSAAAPQRLQPQLPPLPQPPTASVSASSPVTAAPSHSSLSSTVPSSASAFVSNIPPDVLAKVGRNLHLRPHHPLNLVKERIESYFVHQLAASPSSVPSPSASASPFCVFDNLPPRVSVRANFDELLVPASHPSRRTTDTYYFSASDCLRTHTSAHQTHFLRRGLDSFLVFGDCYRRDEIDASHYPVFHQVEGVRVWSAGSGSGSGSGSGAQQLTGEWIVADLQRTLDGLVSYLFGPATPRRWLDDSFPFTSPSLQVEVQFHGRWLEVLGCGVIQPAICAHFGKDVGRHDSSDVKGWAFGLGLERLAMVLFDIPDIRLFWSDDQRFLQQFMPPRSAISPHPPAATASASPSPSPSPFRPIQFQPFSKYPPCPKDLSFFVPASFHDNDMSSVIRSVAGDWVESVQLLETFTHPNTGKESRLYRVVYRSMSHSLTNEEVNRVHNQVRQQLQQQMSIQLR